MQRLSLAPRCTFNYETSWSYYFPNGFETGDLAIKGNSGDLTSGVVGVWLTPDQTGANYFDPRRLSSPYTAMDRLAEPMICSSRATSRKWMGRSCGLGIMRPATMT